jgi:hypothetical protein
MHVYDPEPELELEPELETEPEPEPYHNKINFITGTGTIFKFSGSATLRFVQQNII